MPWDSDDERAFVGVLFAMGEVFNESVSAIRAEMYCRALEDLPFEAVRLAAAAHVRRATFFPKPAELRDGVLGNTEDQAEIAWQHVLREIRRVGYVGTPKWPDGVTERAALGLFGGSWRTLCEHLPAQGPELLGFRKQFVAAFGAAAREAQQGLLPPTRGEAHAALTDLKKALAARGLPSGEL